MLEESGREDLIEEITLGAPSKTASDEMGSQYLEIAKSLRIGTWVQFCHAEGRTTRARLTWISPSTGRYLFTDRRGLKVADSTIYGLAVEFRRGTATVLDNVPLFERAISHLTRRLRHPSGAEGYAGEASGSGYRRSSGIAPAPRWTVS